MLRISKASFFIPFNFIVSLGFQVDDTVAMATEATATSMAWTSQQKNGGKSVILYSAIA